jgi:hypothetical protein
MTDTPHPSPSLLAQILDEMLAGLEDREAFDPATLQQLKTLARHGGLAKPKLVQEAIQPRADEDGEGTP